MADNEKPFTTNEEESTLQEAAVENNAQQPMEEAEASLSPDVLLKTVQEKEAELEEFSRKYQRLQADFENFRRRTTKEKEELSTVVAEGIVVEFLPIIDNFERALSTGKASDAAALYSGVELIFRQMQGAFEKLGVTAIEAVDQTFDPNEHQAVMRVEDETKEDGAIVEELQKGYRLKTRVLRPSMVKVVNNG